ncbi:unnamed protein product, partial [Ectocarpus fasciculatus]
HERERTRLDRLQRVAIVTFSLSYTCGRFPRNLCARQQQKRQLCVHLLVGSITWQISRSVARWKATASIAGKYGGSCRKRK